MDKINQPAKAKADSDTLPKGKDDESNAVKATRAANVKKPAPARSSRS